ncbi:MAG TPA: FkbM family methyltransferase [Gemmataceae bacterium]|jgi:FkbM family methyltransferase|nr:FkbM family methyltransferase [Gemmataceae bacterium]
MTVWKRVRGPLKFLRTSQPFNGIATFGARAFLSGLGARSEWLIKHLHRSGRVSIRLPNDRILRLWSRGDDWVSNQVYWRGWDGYEPETTQLFFRLAAQSTVTLDVGAYVGYFSLLAAHANPAGRVCAFEPLPAVFERLTRNVALNGLTNVECVAAAASDFDGEADFFHIPDGLPTSSSLSAEFMHATTSHHSRVTVARLDRMLEHRDLPRVDLIKVDAETAEPSVLRGAARILERDRPHIFCEVLADRADGIALEKTLRPLGYRYFLLTDAGPEPRERIEGHARWLNYLFTKLTQTEISALAGRQFA